jgi:hypothetical protein
MRSSSFSEHFFQLYLGRNDDDVCFIYCSQTLKLFGTKEITLVFSVSPLSMQHIGIRAKSGCLGIVMMCTGGITCVWPLTVVPESYIMTISFIGGENQSARRKSPTCRKSLTNFIT